MKLCIPDFISSNHGRVGDLRLGRSKAPSPLGLLCLAAVLGTGLDNSIASTTAAAAASAKTPVVIPTSVFVGLWVLLGAVTGAGVGFAVWTVWRVIKYRQHKNTGYSVNRISTFRFYSMVFWSAFFATAADVIFKLLAAYRVFFSETLTNPHALNDWQFLPGLNLSQTFLVMCMASFIALLVVHRLAQHTDIAGRMSAWTFSAATGILVSLLVTMTSGFFFPALDFWRVPGALVLNFVDNKRLVNLADLIGYLGGGLALIAAIFGWRHYCNIRQNTSSKNISNRNNNRSVI